MSLRATVAKAERWLQAGERRRQHGAAVRADAARLVALMVARTVGIDGVSNEMAREAWADFPAIGEGIERLEKLVAARQDKTPKRRRAARAAGRRKKGAS